MKALCFALLCLAPHLGIAESWQEALSQMPLVGTNTAMLNRTNCVRPMLNSFRSNDVVKALIFMPGATDEFFMFQRANAVLTNRSPSLLDAVDALTNQTYIRATFLPPFLLLHTDEDPLEPLNKIKNSAVVSKLKQTPFQPYVNYYDRDWDYLLPMLETTCKVKFLPAYRTMDSWHFYRHSFAAWNLTEWEMLQATAYAGKTWFTVEKNKITFGGDERVRAPVKLDKYPGEIPK